MTGFAPGDRVVVISRPERGSLVVTEASGSMLRAATDGFVSLGPAGHFMPVPEGWREPPPLPQSEAERVRNLHRGLPPLAAERDADRIDGERAADRAGAYREYAAWWAEVGVLICRDEAERCALGFIALAAVLEAEAKRRIA